MSNPKLIDLDFSPESTGVRGAAFAPLPALGETDAATEVRGLIDQLQQTAWEARGRLRQVEEERDALALRFEEVQRAHAELRGRAPEPEALQKELQRYTKVAQEREARAITAEKQTIELQKRCDDLTRQRDDLNRSLGLANRQQRPAESATQLQSLREARDTACAANRELMEKLSRAQDEIAALLDQVESAPVPTRSEADWQTRVDQLEAQLAVRQNAATEGDATQMEIVALQQQREEVLVQLEILSKEVIGLRAQLQGKERDLETQRLEAADAQRKSFDLQASTEPLRAEAQAARLAREEALTSLQAAQKQIERIMRDRDEIREEGKRQTLGLEGDLEKRTAELSRQNGVSAAFESAQRERDHLRDALQRVERDKADLAERHEAQRLQTIELATRFEAAQQEIKLMSARLAEARLLVKACGGKLEEPVEVRPVAPAETAPAGDRFDPAQALEWIRAMRRSYHAFARTPGDLSHLNELHCHIYCLVEHTLATDFVALHRLVSAFDGFVQELYHFPEQINATSIATVPQTIEFLASLMKLKDPRQLKDAADATVYVVEDDPLTCECLTMAMETSMMRGLCSQDPAKAALELAGTACDLILLDINMPGMDGFELCTEIRGMALHRDTPVMFISGMATPDMRAQATRVGGCDFLAKPFILCELNLKALLHIARAQLRIA